MSKTHIFIDGGPFSDGVRGQGLSMNMDLMAFARALAGDDAQPGVTYVSPALPATPYPTKQANQQAMFERLRAQGATVLTAPPRVIGSIFVDAGIETLLSVALLTGDFDRAIVVSNRAALKPALEVVRARGKAVEIAFFDYTMLPGNALAGDAGFTRITTEAVLAHRISGPRPPVFA